MGLAKTGIMERRDCRAPIHRCKWCRQEAVARGYQSLLIDNKQNIEVNLGHKVDYAGSPYPAHPPFYSGAYQFSKHYYPDIGDLKAIGEEFDCAQAIDRWVRNIQREPELSFWLPTSSDRFYPDFVARLKDGRALVVEYKGDQYITNDDSQEKMNISQLWEEKSGGKGLFIMSVKDDKGLGGL